MSTVNVAVVGLGFMGVTHIKAYRKIPNARIAAVCDAVRLPVNGVLVAAGGNIGSDDTITFDMTEVKATKNLDELLADPAIDLIDICVPTLAHPKLSIAALQAGKHVLCEKPLARTAAAAREIADTAANAKGFFMPAMCIRFWPEYVWLKQLIDQQTYGKVLAARFRRVSEPPPGAANTSSTARNPAAPSSTSTSTTPTSCNTASAAPWPSMPRASPSTAAKPTMSRPNTRSRAARPSPPKAAG